MPRHRTAAERVAKWDRRYTGDQVKKIIDTDKELMRENNVAQTGPLVDTENATRQVLNGIGVPTIQVVDYLGFARQVFRLKNLFSGEVLKLEVQTILEKWVARGLAKSTLEAIREDVFTVGSPVAP
jgi:hypothetical protein